VLPLLYGGQKTLALIAFLFLSEKFQLPGGGVWMFSTGERELKIILGTQMVLFFS
jgi:hypothetical protein